MSASNIPMLAQADSILTLHLPNLRIGDGRDLQRVNGF